MQFVCAMPTDFAPPWQIEVESKAVKGKHYFLCAAKDSLIEIN
jgi:hypothetical protein